MVSMTTTGELKLTEKRRIEDRGDDATKKRRKWVEGRFEGF